MKKETTQRHFLKIIAIFFAISLWFYVLNSEPVQIERRLAINYLLPNGYTISNLSEREVTIKIKGSKAFIQNIFNNKEKFNIDLKPYFISDGKTFKVKFNSSDLAVPFGVEILDISPRETEIQLDHLVTMEIPIKLTFIGDAPKDRKIRDIHITPSSLAVSGPVGMIRTISRLESSPIDLSTFSKDEGEFLISLADLDTRLKIVSSPPRVKLVYKAIKIAKVKN